MKKKTKRIIIFCLLIVVISSLLIINVFATNYKYNGYNYSLYNYNYSSDIKIISYNFLVSEYMMNYTIPNATNTHYFCDFMLSMLGTTYYSAIDYANKQQYYQDPDLDPQNILDNYITSHINNGSIFGLNYYGDQIRLQNENIMANFITAFNNYYDYLNEFGNYDYIQTTLIEISNQFYNYLFNGLSEFSSFLYNYYFISSEQYTYIINNLNETIILISSDTITQMSDYSVYNVLTINKYYKDKHLNITFSDFGNSVVDYDTSIKLVKDSANWAFLPDSIYKYVAGLIGFITAFGVTMGIAKLLSKALI